MPPFHQNIFPQWYRDHDYSVEWKVDRVGPSFPDDGTLKIINPVMDHIIAEDWKTDFGTVCDCYRSRILGYLREKGYSIDGIKNGKCTAISALAKAGVGTNTKLHEVQAYSHLETK